jgi:hypothetical protein
MTTRKFPRSIPEAFEEKLPMIDGPYSKHRDADFWVYITLAFAAGFLVSHLWG